MEAFENERVTLTLVARSQALRYSSLFDRATSPAAEDALEEDVSSLEEALVPSDEEDKEGEDEDDEEGGCELGREKVQAESENMAQQRPKVFQNIALLCHKSP